MRLTPLLYHLSQRLLGNLPSVVRRTEMKEDHPLIVVCLEKISNLYRILMLVRDYGGISSIGHQLVLVCDSKRVARFASTAKEFVTKNFLRDSDTNPSESYFPRVISIDKAPRLLASSSNTRSIVGIDLHEDAKTLGEPSNEAMTILSSAGAVIFGFESDGIPELLNKIIVHYVQVQSRTSINVVAAVSIFLHAMRR